MYVTGVTCIAMQSNMHISAMELVYVWATSACQKPCPGVCVGQQFYTCIMFSYTLHGCVYKL